MGDGQQFDTEAMAQSDLREDSNTECQWLKSVTFIRVKRLNSHWRSVNLVITDVAELARGSLILAYPLLLYTIQEEFHDHSLSRISLKKPRLPTLVNDSLWYEYYSMILKGSCILQFIP